MLKLAFIFLALLAAPLSAEVRLIMVEEDGCAWCARWDAEVGDAYALTTEGKIAPLMRVDRWGPLPEGVSLNSPAVFTPTFVLIHDGAEIGRIEGYPGEHFFWPLLNNLINELPEEQRKEPTQ